VTTSRRSRLQVYAPGTEPQPFPYVNEVLAEGLATAADEMAMEPNQLLAQLVRSFLARQGSVPKLTP
jgi:hypothetical protein